SKIHLLMLGKRKELENNKWHGAKYSDKEMSKDFMNEKITILNKGTIPLLYHAINGKHITKSGVTIALKELYCTISTVQAEFISVTKNAPSLFMHRAEIVRDDILGHELRVYPY